VNAQTKEAMGASANADQALVATPSSPQAVSTEGFDPSRGEGASILSIIARAASDPNVDVDKLERLLAMQERVLGREAEQAFNAALREAQDEIGPILRNKTNSSTNSKYADLEKVSEAIDPVFRRHGFSQSFGTADCPMAGHYRVTCRLSHVGGHCRDYQADVPADTAGIKGTANKTATHGFGSALSYGRRYLKLLIADVPTTDDDGRSAGGGGPINKEQVRTLNGLCEAVGADKIAFCRYLRVDALNELQAYGYDNAVSILTQKNPKAAHAFLTGDK
jgi:hypothetical protein